MNPQKSEVKALTLQGIGVQMDDQLESARREVHRYEGGISHLDRAGQIVTAQSKRVDDDLESSAVTADAARYAKERLSGCLHGLGDLLKRAQAGKLGQEGIVAGIERCVSLAKKAYDGEVLKLEAAAYKATRAAEAGEPTEARPRTNTAAEDLRRRRAEARASKASGATDTADEQSPPKRRRRRKSTEGNADGANA